MTRRTPAVALASAALTLAGCALGERPTLTDERLPGDPAVEAVHELLAQADTTAFEASYLITPARAGSAPVSATVRWAAGASLIAIGDVEFVVDDGEQRTCRAGRVDCVPGFDEARISDLSVTSAFWGPSTAQRLLTDAGRMTAVSPAADTIAGQSATCATVTMGTASSTYCATATGPLARLVAADVTIELTAFTPT